MKGRVQEYKLALFKKVVKQRKKGSGDPFRMIYSSIIFGNPSVPGDQWKVAKWVLFRGRAVELQVAMPVFADGKNLNTFMAEWG